MRYRHSCTTRKSHANAERTILQRKSVSIAASERSDDQVRFKGVDVCMCMRAVLVFVLQLLALTSPQLRGDFNVIRHMYVEYFSAPLGLTGLAVLWRLVEDFFLVPKGSTRSVSSYVVCCVRCMLRSVMCGVLCAALYVLCALCVH